jgi:short subunit dehydrogenase-like uncharacterized protein
VVAVLARQRGQIAVYGATGYTGRLVAAELARAGADFVLSGRSETKLQALADELGASAPVRPASLDDPDSLRSLLDGCAAVIDCAGPFALHGEPVLRAAVETSTHYLDTTGEQSYMRMAFERYGPEADRKGVAVIPGMGFDYVPGDMIASLTAEGMGEVDEVLLAYASQGFGATRGTMLSTLEIIRRGDEVEWCKLQLLPAPRSFAGGHFEFPAPIGRRRMARYPSGEHLTVPRHVSTRRVRTLITASTVAPGPLGAVLPIVAPAMGLAMRTPARRLLRAAISRLPEGPSEEERSAGSFEIVCEVRRGKRMRRGVVTGRDVYGLTAATVAGGALITAGRGFSGRGGLAPSQAFEPRSFLDSLDRFDLRWEVEPERDAPALAAA